MRGFVEEQIHALLGMTPPVFMVSSRVAQRTKSAGTSLERYSLLLGSGFEELEDHVLSLLKDEGRVRLKLESPLGIVEELVRRYDGAVGGRTVLLDADLQICRDIESQLLMHEEDMKRDFAARMSQIGHIVRAIYERGTSGLRRTSTSKTPWSLCSARRSRSVSGTR